MDVMSPGVPVLILTAISRPLISPSPMSNIKITSVTCLIFLAHLPSAYPMKKQTVSRPYPRVTLGSRKEKKRKCGKAQGNKIYDHTQMRIYGVCGIYIVYRMGLRLTRRSRERQKHQRSRGWLSNKLGLKRKALTRRCPSTKGHLVKRGAVSGLRRHGICPGQDAITGYRKAKYEPGGVTAIRNKGVKSAMAQGSWSQSRRVQQMSTNIGSDRGAKGAPPRLYRIPCCRKSCCNESLWRASSSGIISMRPVRFAKRSPWFR
jgi:hypothetical protein